MKCPKCHYLSFEPEPRCRNCGYDLEFAEGDLELRTPEPATNAPLDLELRAAEEPGGARTAALHLMPDGDRTAARSMRARERPAPAENHRRRGTAPATLSPALLDDLQPVSGVDAPAAAAVSAMPATPVIEPTPPAAAPIAAAPVTPPAPPAVRAQATTAELPLFIKAMEHSADADTDSDAPLVSVPATPRPPLAVRRRVPESRPASSPSVRSTVDDETAIAAAAGPSPRPRAEDDRSVEEVHAEARALVRAAKGTPADAPTVDVRIAAALIDVAIVAGVSLATIAMTLRILDRPFADLLAVPLVPLATFLLLLVCGYLLLFTVVSGQTIGKMAFGLRVVAADGQHAAASGPLPAAQAATRALMTVPSVLVLGLGFVPALFGGGRAVHDRVAHTRVVRA